MCGVRRPMCHPRALGCFHKVKGPWKCLVLTSNTCGLSAGREGKRVFGYRTTEQLAAGKAAAGMFGNCSKIKIQPVARLVTTSQPFPKESESHGLEAYISSEEQQQQSARKLCRAHLSCLELHRLQPILCQTQQQNAAAAPSLPQSPGAGTYPGW